MPVFNVWTLWSVPLVINHLGGYVLEFLLVLVNCTKLNIGQLDNLRLV